MIRRNRREFLGIALGVGAAAIVGAPTIVRADEVADVLRAITSARSSMKTLVAAFTQTRVIGLLATEVKSDGELTLVCPAELRWQLFPPDAITYWITKEGFAFATPDGGATVGKAAAGRFALVLSDLLVLIGGDLETLKSRYEFHAKRGAEGSSLDAIPKDAEIKRHVARLEMTTGPELWTVRRIVIEEAGGDTSVIEFRDVRRDAAVDPEKMRLPSRK